MIGDGDGDGDASADGEAFTIGRWYHRSITKIQLFIFDGFSLCQVLIISKLNLAYKQVIYSILGGKVWPFDLIGAFLVIDIPDVIIVDKMTLSCHQKQMRPIKP